MTPHSCRRNGAIAALLLATFGLTESAKADPLLDETVAFTGQILFLEHKVPALVIGAVRNREVSIHGFGERSKGGAAPDGDTLMRIGSITKAFTGEVLAYLVAKDKVAFADPFITLAPKLASGTSADVERIRLIDLVTH